MMLRTRQAAEFLGLQKCTLEAWRVRGGGPIFRKLGKAVRYHTQDLEDFLNQAARKNTATTKS